MPSTKEQILNLGEGFIRTRGYTAFSYKDIAQALNVKNAAIHYHFPVKEDLGLAIIQRSIDRGFTDQDWDSLSVPDQLAAILRIYQHSHHQGKFCLMGALSVSVDCLPKSMQTKLDELGRHIMDKTTQTLAKGKQTGLYSFAEAPEAKAEMIISSLLAALLIDKVMTRPIFESITKNIINSIKPQIT